jgi:hypothetical protein
LANLKVSSTKNSTSYAISCNLLRIQINCFVM